MEKSSNDPKVNNKEQKSCLDDETIDALSILGMILIVVAGIYFWLDSMP